MRQVVLSLFVLIAVPANMVTAQHLESASLQSWRDVEKTLQARLSENGHFEERDLTEVIGAVAGDDDRNAILATALEMLGQWNTPLVVLAGFEYIATRSSEDAFPAALLVSSNKPQGANILVFERVIETLNQAKPAEEVFAALDNFAKNSVWLPKPNVAETLMFLPSETLASWLVSRRHTPIPSTFEAQVIGTVLDSDAPEQQQELLRTLKRLSNVPGHCRAIYVTHADDSEPRMADFLKMVLEDPAEDVGTIIVSATRHRELLKSLDLSTFDVQPERAALLQKIVDATDARDEE
jgi:hypothetical protein